MSSLAVSDVFGSSLILGSSQSLSKPGDDLELQAVSFLGSFGSFDSSVFFLLFLEIFSLGSAWSLSEPGVVEDLCAVFFLGSDGSFLESGV